MSQSQILSVYAQSAGELKAEKDAWVATLWAVETAIWSTVGKLDNKLSNSETKEKLQKKHKEIEKYIKEVEQEIKEENNIEEIKEKVEKAKKVAVLKVVAWITPTEDIEDNIDETVASTASQKREALEVAKESLETSSGDYSIIVRSSYDSTKVISRFKTFDTTTKITELYEVSGKNYFEVFIDKDSIFRKEMLEDIENWVLPESFLGIEIVLPEVFSVFATDISGEDLSQTWGIERYKTYNFFEENSGTSKNVSVWVVDTGIDYTHPDLTHVNTQKDKDFVNEDDDAMDDQGHGTHVAGTIWASLNGQWILGVNPHVDMIWLKICTSSGFCPSYAVIKALEYASVENIDILNMSLGGRGNPENHAICAAIDAYTQNGGLVIAAAGNANIPASDFIPGGCSNALTVAAINNSNERASFSNYGPKVDVAAPWTNIFSSYPVNKGSYKRLSGTSMAAPHVAGLVSMMLALDWEMTLSQVKSGLRAFPQAVSSDSSHKTIASAVDVPALLSSYLGAEIQELDEQQPEQAAEVETPVEEQGQGANIAEYIENFSEDVAQEDELPAPHHHPLDDMTLEDVSLDIQSDEVGNFVPEVFNLNPTVQLDQIDINSSEQDSVYKNENSQNFSITDEAETGASTGSFEPIPVPEVIIDEAQFESVQQIKLVPDFEIPGIQDGVEINSSDEAIEITEVVEWFTQHSQSIDATDAVPADTGSIDVQNADDIPAELAETPDPEGFTFVVNGDDSGTGALEPLSEEEMAELQFLTDEERLQLDEEAGIRLQSASYKSCDIYEGQRCIIYIYNHPSTYRINNSNPDAVNLWYARRALIINSGTPWSTSIAMYDHRKNRLRYVISVKVRAVPVVEDVTCEVKGTRECRLKFPDLEYGSNVTFKSTNTNRYLQPVYDGETKEVVIPTYRLWIKWGTVPIEVFNNGYKIANLTLSITPNVPEYECILLTWHTCQIKLRYKALYEFDHKTGGIVSGYSSGNSDIVHMTAQAGWDELTYLRIWSDYHAAIRTKVISSDDITVPTEDCNLVEDRWRVSCQVEILGASMLDYTVTTPWIVSLIKNGNTLTIQSEKVWTTQVHVKYGWVTLGTINVTITTLADSFVCRLNIWKNCRVYLGSYADQMSFQQTQWGLVDLALSGDKNRYLYITAKQTGHFRIYVWDRDSEIYKAQIEVIITEPSTGSCSILEGGKCDIQWRSDKFNYEVLKDGVQVGEYRRNGRLWWEPKFIEVMQVSWNDNVVRTYAEWLRAGEVELHIYRRDFDNYYKQHILDIEVIEAPFEATSFCETRVNGSCQITLRNIGTDKYTIQYTAEWIVESTLKRDYLYIKWAKEGTFEILITNNETGAVVHRGNVLIEGFYNVTVPRPQTKLSQTSITLDVGASQLIEITQGNSATAYRVVADYPNIEVSQASSSGFTIKATNADHESVKVHFIDKETQYATAKLFVSVNGDNSGGDNSGGDSWTGSSTWTGNTNIDYDVLSNEINISLNEIFTELWINISADETVEQWELASKLPNQIVIRADEILYDGVKKKLENISDDAAINILNKFINTFEQKQWKYSWKSQTLAKYITVTLKIFKVEREFDKSNSEEIQRLKNEIIILEQQLLESNYELTLLKQEMKVNAWEFEWYNQAVSDYITWYVELADITEIPQLIKWVANANLDDIWQGITEFYDIYTNREEILAGLEPEKKAYYTSYIKTTLALETIPVKLNKVDKFKGKGDSEVYSKLIDLLRVYKINKIKNDPEVQKTLERINIWIWKYDRDGIEFRNDQKFLPIKEKWYYTEWTVDTPWLNHRWEKRIVVWSNGEQYYTADHYRTKEGFIKIN